MLWAATESRPYRKNQAKGYSSLRLLFIAINATNALNALTQLPQPLALFSFSLYNPPDIHLSVEMKSGKFLKGRRDKAPS